MARSVHPVDGPRSEEEFFGPWSDEKELDPARILTGINGCLSMKCYGAGRSDVQAQLVHYDDDDSLEEPSPEMAFILVTHEWFSVKISLYPTWDGALSRMNKKFWCSHMIISRGGFAKEFVGFEQCWVTMLRAGLKFLQGYYLEEQQKKKKR